MITFMRTSMLAVFLLIAASWFSTNSSNAGVLLPAQVVVPALPAGCSLSFSATDYVYVAPTGTSNNERLWVFPGLGNTNAQWDALPFSYFITQAAAAGYSIVEVNVPANPTACYWTNGGWQYRDGFVANLNTIRAAIDTAHGIASKNIAGGFSYGGLHAMMAAASLGWFDAWWAHMPVTRLDQLTEFAGVGDVPRFNPFYVVDSLKMKPGWISRGTLDTRTNTNVTAELMVDIGIAATDVVYTGEDHSTTQANIDDILNGIAAQ